MTPPFTRFAAIAALLLADSAAAATVLFSPLETLDGWSLHSYGPASATFPTDASGSRHLALTAQGGTILLSRELPVADSRAARITLRCQAKAETVVRGPQASSTAKIHLAVETPQGVIHQSVRLTGSSDWHREGLSFDVPAAARRIVLNMGLEACSGAVEFRQLLVENDRRLARPLDLGFVLNAAHDQIGLTDFPAGTLELAGIRFKMADGRKQDGLDCLRLRGEGHREWPPATAAPIAVGVRASAIYLLHGCIGSPGQQGTPTAIWTALFADGQDAGFSVFEGREIGPPGHTEDLPNWKFAWQGKDGAGKPVSFGVTKWTIYSDSPLVGLECRAYRGSATVVLAATAVEEPPRRIVEGAPGDDEWSGEQ